MRVLVVEDEPAIRQQLVKGLQDAKFAVDACEDGREAHYMGDEHDYDIAIVDLGLPEMDGVEVIKRWRSNNRNFPVLILTARDRWQDKVEGLESGADDYVAKPFQMEEILARVNALIRRSAGHATSNMVFGELEIDIQGGIARRAGKALELTTFEFNSLQYLALRAGQVVSKTELTEHLYDQDFDRDSNVIEVFIARLRKKIDPEGDLKPIATVRGRGYRFELTKDS